MKRVLVGGAAVALLGGTALGWTLGTGRPVLALVVLVVALVATGVVVALVPDVAASPPRPATVTLTGPLVVARTVEEDVTTAPAVTPLPVPTVASAASATVELPDGLALPGSAA